MSRSEQTVFYRGSAIEQGSWFGETAILASSGQEIPVSHLIIAHRDEAGELEYFSTVMRNISDVKQLIAEQPFNVRNCEIHRITASKRCKTFEELPVVRRRVIF